MRVLVTGNAGFIGYHLTWKLLQRGDSVVGFDSVNDYYDPQLKNIRLARLASLANQDGLNYATYKADLAHKADVETCFATHTFDCVIHLAAQAGVRYSLEKPMDYIHSNIVGFTNVLESCRHHGIAHLTYASTSSVYGAHTSLPYSEDASAVHPLQLYAATKRANELMAHSYSHLFGLPTTGLRFFTVYGPWGRPDMALFRFTKNILEGKPIDVYNHGKHSRDFTYVDDIVRGIIDASDAIAAPDPSWCSDTPNPATSNAPWRVINIGNSKPIALADYIGAIERATGKKAQQNLMPLQPGDIPDTYADTSRLHRLTGYTPTTSVEDGVAAFVRWYRKYYKI